MKNKLVMITGSTGFIGQRLVALAPPEFEVYAPTRYDLENPSHLRMADFIIHAAGYAAPSMFMSQPLETIKVNTVTLFTLLDHLAPGGRFLYCSSGEVYKGLENPVTEDEIGTTTPYHPRAPYIEGKRCGEAIINAYRSKGVQAMSARMGLTYGPGTRKHDARVLNQFIEKALLRRFIDLADDGKAAIRICYIDDMVKMLWQILLHGTRPVYNVGGIEDTTIFELAQLIAFKTNVPVLRAGEPSVSQFKMDISRYRAEFGATHFTHLTDGLDETIEYQRGLYDV